MADDDSSNEQEQQCEQRDEPECGQSGETECGQEHGASDEEEGSD